MLSKDERAFTNPSLLRYTADNLSNVNQREVRSESSLQHNDCSSAIPLNKTEMNRAKTKINYTRVCWYFSGNNSRIFLRDRSGE